MGVPPADHHFILLAQRDRRAYGFPSFGSEGQLGVLRLGMQARTCAVTSTKMSGTDGSRWSLPSRTPPVSSSPAFVSRGSDLVEHAWRNKNR